MRLVCVLAFLGVFAATDLVQARGGRSGRRVAPRTGGAGAPGGTNPGRTGSTRTGTRGSERIRDLEELAVSRARLDLIQQRRETLGDLDRRASQERVLTTFRIADADRAAEGESAR